MQEKKTIPAKQVLEDFRAGATNEFLMKKYGLSEKGLQSLFKRLLDMKAITQVELDQRASRTEPAIVELDGIKETPLSLQSVVRKKSPATGIEPQASGGSTTVEGHEVNPEKTAATPPPKAAVSQENFNKVAGRVVDKAKDLRDKTAENNEPVTRKLDSLVLCSLLAGLITGWAFARIFTITWSWYIFWLALLGFLAWIGYYVFLERYKNKTGYVVVASTVFTIALMGIYSPKATTSQTVSGDAGKLTSKQISQRTPGVGNPKALGDCQEPEIPFPVQQVRKDAPGSEALSALLRSEVILSDYDWSAKQRILKTIFQGQVPDQPDLIQHLLETEYNLPPVQKHPKDPYGKVRLSRFVDNYWPQIVGKMTSEKLSAAPAKEDDQSGTQDRLTSPHGKKLEEDIDSSDYLINKLVNGLRNEGLEDWVVPFQTVADLVRSSIDKGIGERKPYLQALKARESRIARCREAVIAEEKQRKEAEQERLDAQKRQEQERYVQEIKSGKRPVASIDDAQIKLAAADGMGYVVNPPTSTPSDSRYLLFVGGVETQQGDLIICEAGPPHKWAFKATGIKSYMPRVNVMVRVIGKISGVASGTTVIGNQIYMVVVDAVAIQDSNGNFYQR